MRLEEKGKKCWRVRERECLRMGSAVWRKWCVGWGKS